VQDVRRADLLRARRIGDDEPRPAVGDEVRVVVRPVERVDRDRHHADPHRPKEDGRKPRTVVHHEKHALAALNPEVAETYSDAARPGVELAVGDGLVAPQDRRLLATAGFEVAIQQLARVVPLRNLDR
jgi:hypothetical protein